MRIKGQLNKYTSETKWCQKIQDEVLSRIISSDPDYYTYDADGNIPYPKIADPFAANNNFATWEFTNDLNVDCVAYNCEDAIDFLRHLEYDHTESFDLVVFDPPFSFNQAEKYVGSVTNVYTAPKYVKQCFASIYDLLKPGGYVLKFGFNSTRDHVGLDLVKYWVINHGGNHNDTIVTLWHKGNMTLNQEF